MVRPVEEICGLCGETFRYYELQRCHRCKRLYCRNCIALEQGQEILCLRCFRRIASPKGSMSKYSRLSIYLARRAKYGNYATLPFRRVEEIIRDDLPYSAYHYPHWWKNVRGRSPSEAWLTAGWTVQEVDLKNQQVIFQRKQAPESEAEHRPSKRKRRQKRLTQAFKALVHRQTRRKTGPSKTRTAKVQARAKNIGRAGVAPQYARRLKPRKAYEKRLYKPEEKETPK